MEYHRPADSAGLVAGQLVELLRGETDLSADVCKSTAISVLQCLSESLNLHQHLHPVVQQLRKDDFVDIEGCSDTQQLLACINTVREFHDDAQQRSWSLFEDKAAIIGALKQFGNLLRLSDRRVPPFVFRLDEFHIIGYLAEFYQMETRLAVKLALLDAVICVCKLGCNFVDSLLNTSLPTSVSTDVLTEQSPALKRRGLETLRYLFCTGSRIPIEHYGTVNTDFVSTLLCWIEREQNSAKIVDNDSFADACICAVLAFNLHFDDSEQSQVVAALDAAEPSIVAPFIERILILFNRQDEPVWPFADDEPFYVCSVLKLIWDIGRCQSLADRLFYSNDAAVLIAVILREVSNLHTGKRRLKLINVLSALLMNSDVCGGREAAITETLEPIIRSEEPQSGTESDDFASELRLSKQILDRINEK